MVFSNENQLMSFYCYLSLTKYTHRLYFLLMKKVVEEKYNFVEYFIMYKAFVGFTSRSFHAWFITERRCLSMTSRTRLVQLFPLLLFSLCTTFFVQPLSAFAAVYSGHKAITHYFWGK